MQVQIMRNASSANRRKRARKLYRSKIEDDQASRRGACKHILSWPPSLWMAWTKQWCRSGVHLRRGTLDLLYCLTPPLLSLPTTVVLTMVIS
jgi:hypothetical protein